MDVNLDISLAAYSPRVCQCPNNHPRDLFANSQVSEPTQSSVSRLITPYLPGIAFVLLNNPLANSPHSLVPLERGSDTADRRVGTRLLPEVPEQTR